MDQTGFTPGTGRQMMPEKSHRSDHSPWHRTWETNSGRQMMGDTESREADTAPDTRRTHLKIELSKCDLVSKSQNFMEFHCKEHSVWKLRRCNGTESNHTCGNRRLLCKKYLMKVPTTCKCFAIFCKQVGVYFCWFSSSPSPIVGPVVLNEEPFTMPNWIWLSRS